MKVKKKITKKKLKQPDEFLTFTEKSFLLFNQHIKKIVVAAALALLLFLTFFLFRMWDERREEAAGQKFIAALEAYSMADSPYRESSPAPYKKALEEFEEIVRAYPRTSSGKLSLMYTGALHLRLGELDEAVRAYETFLKKSGKERLYQLFALESLGYAHERKNEYEKAAQIYQKIIKWGESYDWAGAHLNLARCYEKLGKTSEALENYRAFLKISQKSSSNHFVLRKISALEN